MDQHGKDKRDQPEVQSTLRSAGHNEFDVIIVRVVRVVILVLLLDTAVLEGLICDRCCGIDAVRG
jgi:hypothetical protein